MFDQERYETLRPKAGDLLFSRFDINDLPALSLTRIVPEELVVSMEIATSDRPTWFD